MFRRWIILLGLIVLVSCSEDIELVAPDVTLTASAVVIEQGESVTLSWDVLGTEPLTLVLEPPQSVPLSSPLTVTPTETTTYTLTATNTVDSDSSSVTVNVNIPEPPVPDPTSARIETLTREVMSTPLSITLIWSLEGDATASCTVDVGDGSTPRNIDNCRTVTQVSHTYAQAGTYTITLTLDSGLSQSITVVVDEVTLTPDNRAPVVIAGTDVDARVGEVITFTGQATDEDGDDLSFVWELVDSPDTSRAELTNADILTTTFTADVAGAYVLRLTVSDGTVSVTDELTVRVLPADAQVVNSMRIVALEDLQVTEGTSQVIQLERWGSTRDRLVVNVQLSMSDATDASDLELVGATLVDGVYQVMFEPLRSRTEITLRAPEDSEVEGLERARLVLLDGASYDLVNPTELAIVISDSDVTPEPPTPNLRVCQGDIVASSQADVEKLRGCTALTRSLRIDPQAESTLGGMQDTPITSLAPLRDLTEVGRGLTIANTDITSLDGLENIVNIGDTRARDGLFIINNDSLRSLQGLDSLTNMPGNLSVTGNALLVDLAGLEMLTNLVDVTIIDNPQLISLRGLDNLSTLLSSLFLEDNPQLASLNALANLREVEDGLFVINNDALANLTGLDAITTFNSFVEISDNDALTDLTGLGSARLMGPGLRVMNNAILTSLNGLDSLQTVGGIVVTDNPSLTSLTGMPRVQTISGGLSLQRNNVLRSLVGLDNVRLVEGTVRVIDNAELESLSGLDNLQAINGGLLISQNSALRSLTGFENLTTLTGVFEFGFLSIFEFSPMLATLYLDTNPALTSLVGLNSLEEIPGNVYVRNNASLTSFEGLASLVTIGGLLEVINNDALTSLAGLTSLETLDGTLKIANNPELATLNGLSTLREVEVDLEIEANPALTDLAGLTGLERIGSQLRIINNSALTTLAGLTNLQTVASDITVSNNQVLTTLEGLTTLADYDDINFVTVSLNPLLDCAALSLPFTVDLSTGNLTSCRIGDTARICEGDYSVTQQVAELAALAGCEEITGSLTIGADPFRPEDGITSLVPLTNLQTVGGTLRIIGNRALPSLEGLNNLRAVGSLVIDNNDQVQSLTPLANLTTINRDLRINRTNVSSLTGLEGIRSLVNLSVSDSANLTTLGALQLEQVTGGIRIEGNAALTSLAGLDGLSTIGGSLRILSNGLLTSLDALASIETIGGTLELDENAITSLADLSNLTTVGGNFVLGANALTSLAGPANLTQVGGRLEVEGGNITTLTGFDSLTQVGELLIYSRSLISLAGLDNLMTVLGDVAIGSNDALETLTGLDNLAAIAGDLVISNNASLTSITALTSLTSLTGDIIIGRPPQQSRTPGNDQLRSLAGLENITNYDDTNTVIINFNRNLDCTPPPALLFSVDESTDNAVNCIIN